MFLGFLDILRIHTVSCQYFSTASVGNILTAFSTPPRMSLIGSTNAVIKDT